MTLADLRKLSIKKQCRIRFVMANGMECVVTQHGIAQVPALQGIPDFNVESELAAATEFLIESAVSPADKKTPPKSRTVTRDELAAIAGAAGTAAPAHDEHDDE